MIRGGKQVDKFNSDTHTRCWKKYKVRPDETLKKRFPEKVKAEYQYLKCVFSNYYIDTKSLNCRQRYKNSH